LEPAAVRAALGPGRSVYRYNRHPFQAAAVRRHTAFP